MREIIVGGTKYREREPNVWEQLSTKGYWVTEADQVCEMLTAIKELQDHPMITTFSELKVAELSAFPRTASRMDFLVASSMTAAVELARIHVGDLQIVDKSYQIQRIAIDRAFEIAKSIAGGVDDLERSTIKDAQVAP